MAAVTPCEGCAGGTGSGISRAGCRQCELREIARGPAFFASMRHGRLTPEYRVQIRALGSDEAAVHAEVKAMAKTIVMGSVAA